METFSFVSVLNLSLSLKIIKKGLKKDKVRKRAEIQAVISSDLELSSPKFPALFSFHFLF